MLGRACHVRLGVGGRGRERCTHITVAYVCTCRKGCICAYSACVKISHTHHLSLLPSLPHPFSLSNAFFLTHRHSNTLMHSHTHNHTHPHSFKHTHAHTNTFSFRSIDVSISALDIIPAWLSLSNTHTHAFSLSDNEKEARTCKHNQNTPCGELRFCSLSFFSENTVPDCDTPASDSSSRAGESKCSPVSSVVLYWPMSCQFLRAARALTRKV